jgi:hypothetical protein
MKLKKGCLVSCWNGNNQFKCCKENAWIFLKAYADYTVLKKTTSNAWKMTCFVCFVCSRRRQEVEIAPTRRCAHSISMGSISIRSWRSLRLSSCSTCVFSRRKVDRQDLGTGPSWTCLFDGAECLDAKRESKKCFQLDEKQMIAIMDRYYGPEYANYGRSQSPNASVSLIKRRFFRWNPSFFFAFFYHPSKECWTPYLGVVVGEIRRRRAMRELWKRQSSEANSGVSLVLRILYSLLPRSRYNVFI